MTFAHPDAGYEPDRLAVWKRFRLGQLLTVESIEVLAWRTEVGFVEAPGERFNSVLFEPVDDSVLKFTEEEARNPG